MNITKKEIDALNAELTITIQREEYSEKVEDTLKKYRKTAKIAGFRPGKAPMSMIRKRYHEALVLDEVNQIIQKNLNDYLQEEKLSILGNPLPKPKDELNWEADSIDFEFELGLAPDFDIDLSQLNLTHYKIRVSDEEINEYIENFRKRYGSLKNIDQAEEGATLHGELVPSSDADAEPKPATIELKKVKDVAPFSSLKIGDKVEVQRSNTFADETDTEFVFGEQDSENPVDDFTFTVNEISVLQLSEINKELFDKVYPDAGIETEEDFREHIRTESEKMYVNHTNNELIKEAVEQLLENVQFDLPKDFLVKWVQHSSEKITDEAMAVAELEKSEKGLRYQLIESKIAEKYNLSVAGEEVEAQAKASIQQQMAMYGYNMSEGEELDNYAKSALQNQQEYERIMNQVFQNKMLQVVKEHATLNEKELTFEAFMDTLEQQRQQEA